jgi:hypothetical protein
MTTKEAIAIINIPQYQVIQELKGGFKVLISFNLQVDAEQYVANLEDKQHKYMIFEMIIKDVIFI